jgi:hypothetical protein
MTTRKIFLGSLLGVGLFCGGVLYGQRPVENIDSHRHPNLASAQHHLQEAWGNAEEARKENKDELGGHAQKAQEHIEAADMELKAAAEFADHRR